MYYLTGKIRKDWWSHRLYFRKWSEKQWMENRVMGMSWGMLADRAADRSATGLVPSQARTCERKVDAPHRPPSTGLHLPSRLSFSTWLACHLSSGWPLPSVPSASQHHLALARFSLIHASSLWTWWSQTLCMDLYFVGFFFCEGKVLGILQVYWFTSRIAANVAPDTNNNAHWWSQ